MLQNRCSASLLAASYRLCRPAKCCSLVCCSTFHKQEHTGQPVRSRGWSGMLALTRDLHKASCLLHQPLCSSKLACSAAGPDECQPSRRLFLYSKDDCALCDGLKAKVQALLDRAQFMPSPLSGVHLEIRDITTNKEWWEAYSLVIPVLTFADPDGGNEVKVPRPSPRISADRLQEHLLKAMAASDAHAQQ